MKVPLKYMIKNFRNRKTSTIITVAGITLVIFVFSAVLMLANGVRKTLASTGSPDNVVVTRKGANGEISSIIGGEIQDVVATLPYIARDTSGASIISAQPVVVINLTTPDGALNNVTLRGVNARTIFELHPNIEIVQGRMFNPSLHEVIVGESVAKRYPQARIGGSIKLAGGHWTVVGVFDAHGSGFDSEIWGDYRQVQQAFDRGNYVSSITLKLDKASDFQKFKEAFSLDKRLSEYQATPEPEYFAEQSQSLTTFIKVLGIFVTVIFSIGAAIGAMITMYSEVANRTVEIGTMRALGFGRRSVLTVFLLEAILISLVGGAIGIVLSSFLQFISITTLNYSSFSDLTFSFAMTASTVQASIIFAIIMGFVGGFLPSARAARLNIVSALRGG